MISEAIQASPVKALKNSLPMPGIRIIFFMLL